MPPFHNFNNLPQVPENILKFNFILSLFIHYNFFFYCRYSIIKFSRTKISLANSIVHVWFDFIIC